MTAPFFAASAAERAWIGTTQRIPLRDTAAQIRTADLVVTDAVHLGCGCFRLYADRPGPGEDEVGYAGISTEVQFLIGACGLHHDERESQ